MTALLFIVMAWALSVFITAAAIISAPEGYEDEHGWHAGRMR